MHVRIKVNNLIHFFTGSAYAKEPPKQSGSWADTTEEPDTSGNATSS